MPFVDVPTTVVETQGAEFVEDDVVEPGPDAVRSRWYCGTSRFRRIPFLGTG
ncbi:hypothetical protein [Streptomyces phaeochromogenes]|uniref:hypothetical protein n=1 Tax=Streptomyces phaeochromogenes TaxID=1923 RepID=UPI00371E872B